MARSFWRTGNNNKSRRPPWGDFLKASPRSCWFAVPPRSPCPAASYAYARWGPEWALSGPETCPWTLHPLRRTQTALPFSPETKAYCTQRVYYQGDPLTIRKFYLSFLREERHFSHYFLDSDNKEVVWWPCWENEFVVVRPVRRTVLTLLSPSASDHIEQKSCKNAKW